ncbi:unnamed protein product [Effrenium voratum]|nr:unnamed protein product [Effrenium voratum]
MDLPLRAYSPEDDRVRDQSTRENRRISYKAPEIFLRQAVYGSAVDVWPQP